MFENRLNLFEYVLMGVESWYLGKIHFLIFEILKHYGPPSKYRLSNLVIGIMKNRPDPDEEQGLYCFTVLYSSRDFKSKKNNHSTIFYRS